jgi:hypothetical protein
VHWTVDSVEAPGILEKSVLQEVAASVRAPVAKRSGDLRPGLREAALPANCQSAAGSRKKRAERRSRFSGTFLP